MPAKGCFMQTSSVDLKRFADGKGRISKLCAAFAHTHACASGHSKKWGALDHLFGVFN